MIRTIAVDDEPLSLELVETYCRRFDFLQFDQGFSNTAAAMNYIEKNAVDLLFLDIRMPAVSGMDFYRTLTHKPMLIFATSYGDYALESYDHNAVDYLLKPFTLARFEKAVLKSREIYNLVHNATAPPAARSLLLKADYGLVKINLSEVLFVEGLDNYLKIHLQNGLPVIVRLTLKALMEKLHEKEFVRVHRSYIVPVNRIESLKQKTITVACEEIPVGRNYEDTLKAILNKKVS